MWDQSSPRGPTEQAGRGAVVEGVLPCEFRPHSKGRDISHSFPSHHNPSWCGALSAVYYSAFHTGQLIMAAHRQVTLATSEANQICVLQEATHIWPFPLPLVKKWRGHLESFLP